ncbi:MAG: GMC family oxidoreductase, partial [Bacteroidota bacterium]
PDRFDGYPDPTETKADAQTNLMKKALCRGGVELWTHTKVQRLVTDDEGHRITKVEAVRQGESLRFSAPVIVLAAGATNSAALLLQSRGPGHPQGIGNQNDCVGRYLMKHNNTVVLAVSDTPNPTKFGKTLGLTDFYFGHTDFPYPMGLIQMAGKSDKYIVQDTLDDRPELDKAYIAKHALDFWLTTEDLPDRDNRVLLREDGNIQLQYQPNNTRAHQQLLSAFRQILKRIGCREDYLTNFSYLGSRMDIGALAHQCGTLRMGSDPGISVTDPFGKVHGMDNLFVADSSLFPSSGAVNPSLTVIALALRNSQQLIRQHRQLAQQRSKTTIYE